MSDGKQANKKRQRAKPAAESYPGIEPVMTGSRGRPKVWTEEAAAELGRRFIEWAKTDDAIVIEEFLAAEGVHYDRSMHLQADYEIFRECYRVAQQMIGARREKLGLQGHIDSAIVRKTAPLYNPRYANWELKLRGMDNRAVNRALNIFCRGIEADAEQAVSELDE